MEFHGGYNCNKNSPILCGTIICSCGWSICVTIILILSSDYKKIHREDNRGIADTILSLFISHKTNFRIVHNVYAFKIKVFGTNIGPDHPMS